jgi:ABC-type glycerol-3-phosphate transport system substrate-binding protein
MYTQTSLVPLFYKDNGNTIQDAKGDVYGFVSDCYISIDPYQTTATLEILRKNGEGEYEWAFDNERIYDVTEKVLKLYYGTDNAMYVASGTDFQEATRAIFSEGNAAMATLCLQALEHATMRNMSDEYGVVPIPKFDQTIEGYPGAMHDGYTVAIIPTTVQGERLDQMSAILEAMGSASYRIIKPAYYELTLRTKLAKDPQSAAMMEILVNSIVIDPGIIYSNNMGGFHAHHRWIIAGKANNTSSEYKKLSATAKKQLKNITQKLDKLVEE